MGASSPSDVSPSIPSQSASGESQVPSAYSVSSAKSNDALIVSTSWISKSPWSFPHPASTMRKGRRRTATRRRLVEMLFMWAPIGQFAAVGGPRLEEQPSASLPGQGPARRGEDSPWRRGYGLVYFQNISMPPPTISTPKPAARFQSPIGSGSCPEER